MRILNTKTMFAELQQDMIEVSMNATSAKMLATNRQIKGYDPFKTYLESVNINDQTDLGDRLVALLKSLVATESGCDVFGYDDLDYKAIFINMDKIVIDLPDEGQQGDTLFDLYKYNVEDATKERIRTSLASSNRRCTIVEGKTGNGFLVEIYDRNLTPLVKLANRLGCTIRGVINRIDNGLPLTGQT